MAPGGVTDLPDDCPMSISSRADAVDFVVEMILAPLLELDVDSGEVEQIRRVLNENPQLNTLDDLARFLGGEECVGKYRTPELDEVSGKLLDTHRLVVSSLTEREWGAALKSGTGPGGGVEAGEWGERVCRGCGCTDYAACSTVLGPCSWRARFDDNTGICSACPMPSVDSYKGLGEAAATERAAGDGYVVRVTCRDGHHFPVTRDYREDRVNFSVEAGLVASAQVG